MLLWTGQRSIVIVAMLLGCMILFTACAREPANDSERWRVQHYKMPCMGEGPRLCYLIDRGKGDFEYFYDEIEGFEYHWGFSYEIVVTATTQPATADASTLQYRLAAASEMRRAPADAIFSLPLKLDGQALVEAKDGICTLLGAIEIEAGEQYCDELRGRDTAIFRHHATELKLVPVTDARFKVR